MEIKETLVEPYLISKSFSSVYGGCVMAFIADENGNKTNVDIRTSHVVEYDINEDQTEVMIKTRSGSHYRVIPDKDFINGLLEYMGDK